MPFFDKILELCKALKPEINMPNLRSIGFFSQNKEIIQITPQNDIQLNPSKADSDQKKIIKNILEEALKNDHLALEDKNKELIDEINQSQKKNEPILRFFKNKISEEDFEILRKAVLIKEKFDLGENVDEHKRQIRFKHGQRGNAICNIYSAGYFEELIKPICISLNDPESFKALFDKLIRDFPFAFFVNRYDDKFLLENRINHQIEKNRKYGIKYLNLHGIGETNTKKIENILERLTQQSDVQIKEVNKKESIILVTIKIV